MKRITGALVVLVAIIFMIQMNWFEPVAEMDYKGYVVSDADMETALREGGVKETVLLTKVKEQESVYEQFGKYYIGSEHIYVDKRYPLYFNDDTAIQFLADGGVLYDDRFDPHEVFGKTILSDGVLFDRFQINRDEEEYWFYGMENGLFLNTRAMTVKTQLHTVEIPMNSVLGLQEDSLRYFRPAQGTMIYGALTDMEAGSEITIGDDTLTYRQLLLNLSVIREETEDPETVKAETETEAAKKEKDKQNAAGSQSRIEEGDAVGTGDADPAGDAGGAGDAGQTGNAGTGNSDGNGNAGDDADGNTDGNAENPGEDEDDADKPGEDEDDADKPGADEDDADKPGEDEDDADKPGEDEDDADKPGADQDNSGNDGNSENNGNQGNGGDSGDNSYQFIPPTIELGDFTSTVYSIDSQITVKDPQKCLVKGRAELQVWKEGRLYMRKYYKKDSQVHISNLEPEMEYTIKTVYRYIDEKGEQIEKTLADKEIWTKSIDELETLDVSYKNGGLYPNQMELKELLLANPQDSEVVQGLTRVVIEIDGNKFSLNAMQMTELKTGHPVDYLSSKRLKADQKNIPFTIRAYDRFDNELKLTGGEGTVTTCKKAPAVSVRVISNKVSNVKLKVTLTKESEIEIKDYYMEITLADSGEILKRENLDQNQSEEEFYYEDLDANKVLDIKVYGTFDTEDGTGEQTVMLAEGRVVTVPLSTLGLINTVTTVHEVRGTEADLSLRINKTQTDERLVKLLHSLTLHITDPSGKEVITRELKGKEAEALRNGEDVPIDLKNLQSAQDYGISVTGKVKHGTSVYEHRVANNLNSFRTNRQDAVIQIKDKEIRQGTVKFKVRAVDPDGAVTDGYVGLKVTSNNHKVIDAHVIDTVKNGEDTEAGWVSYELNDLGIGDSYFFSFNAKEYNVGFTNATRIMNYEFPESFVALIPAGIQGEMSLKSIEASADNMNVSLKYKITDASLKIENRTFYFDVYEEGGKLYKSFPYPMLGDGIIMDDAMQPAVLPLPKGHEFTIELRVVDTTVQEKPEKLVLAKIQVSTKVPVKEIATPEALYQVKDDPSGHYVVVADLDCTSGTERIDAAFSGQIDFQGHTLKFRASNERPHLFGRNEGTLKNLVLETGIRSDGDAHDVYGFVRDNAGTVENLIVNFAESTVGSEGNQRVAGVIGRNETNGVLRNFAVNAYASLAVSQQASYGVSVNEGKVYNGYVQGQPINAVYENKEFINYDVNGTADGASFKNVGGIVGRNTASGLVEEVYSVVDVYRGKLVPDVPNDNAGGTLVTRYDEAATGGIIGRNEGTMRNGYAFVTADPDESDPGTYQYGPAVGRNNPATKTNENTYYTSEKNYGDVRLNKKVSKLQLNDLDFHNGTINQIENGLEFDTGNYVPMGYYPHIILPDCMPRQEMVPLPVVDESEAVDIKSIEVAESGDDFAVINLVLNNPGMGDVKSIKIQDINKVEILSQSHDLRYTNVQIRVSEPEKYRSEYDFASVTIKNNYTSGRDITRTYDAKEKTFLVEFYRPIVNTTEWDAYVVQDGTENYKLQADLNFSGVEDKFVHVPTLNGVLNGNGHTLSNISFTGKDKVNERGVIAKLGGAVKNLQVKNLKGEYLNAFVYQTDSQKTTALDNIYLENVLLNKDASWTGALLGKGYGTTVTNCGANGVTIAPTTNNTNLGGLIGELSNGGTVRNCFIVNADITIAGNRYHYGVGGLIGYLNGTMSNCYAQGKIVSDTGNVGGLISEINGATSRVSECYAAVDIEIVDQWSSHKIPAAGIASEGTQTVNTLDNVLSIGNVSATKYQTEPKRIGVSVNAANAKLMNAYAAKSQRINGKVQNESAEVRELLTYEQLKDPATYTDKLRFGADFDLSPVASGYFPKLYYAGTTELLPGQADIPIPQDDQSKNVEVTGVSVNDGATDSAATIVFDLTHSPEYKVDSLSFKNGELEVVKFTQQRHNAQSSSLIVDVKAKKFYDSYTLEKIDDVTVNVKVDQIFYKWITDVHDWNAIDANSYENYRIVNDLKFDENSSRTMKRNIKVNRMIGPSPENPTTISGIKLELDGDTIPANSANVIQEVRREFGNLKVEDFSISTMKEGAKTSKYNTTIAFVANYDANIHDLEIKGMRINAQAYDDEKPYYRGTGVGFFGANLHSWATGLADNIRISDVYMTGNTYVGAFSGDQKANGQLRNVYGTDIHVKGDNARIGGFSGYGYVLYGVLENSTVTNARGDGDAYTGALLGSGHVTYSAVKDCEVTTIYTGTSNQTKNLARFTGGITGSGGVRNCYAENTTVTGAHCVGGLSGYHNGYNPGYNNYVLNSTIKGMKNVGGIWGLGYSGESYRTQNSGIVGSTVTGLNNVGGITGLAYENVGGYFVRNTTVTAEEGDAGGVIGQFNGANPHKIVDNTVQAAVNAPNGSAGGIIGFLNFKGDARGENALELNNNIVAGEVSAGSSAGALAGKVDRTDGKELKPSLYTKEWNGNLLLGNVTAPQTSPSVGNWKWDGAGKPQEKTTNMKIYAKAKIGDETAEHMTALAEAGCIVGKTELSDPAFYIGLGYKNYDGVKLNTQDSQTEYYWNYEKAGAGGFLPNAALGYTNVATLRGEPSGYKVIGNDESGKPRYSILPDGTTVETYQKDGRAIQTDLPVPDETMTARAFRMEEGEELPKTEVYTSGIDSLNIEFSHTGENLCFYLKEEPETQYPIDTQLVTLTYDFKEPFTIVVSNGADEREIQIFPAAFTRKVLTYGDEYYYVRSEGAAGGKGTLLEGDFIHLYEGKALSRTGEIRDLASGETLGSVTGVRVAQEAKPLWSFQMNGTEVVSYGGLSSVGEETTRPMQLFAKDGVLGALDGSLDIVKDSVIFDRYQEEDYQTVLGKDGRVYDLKDRIHMPKDFDNKDIKYMTHNLYSDSHYVLFEYNTGSVAGFDYVTGEMLFEEKVESQMSFFEFAKSFLNFDLEEPAVSEEAPEVYKQIEILADKLSKDPIESVIGGKLEDDSADGSLSDDRAGAAEDAEGAADPGIAGGAEGAADPGTTGGAEGTADPGIAGGAEGAADPGTTGSAGAAQNEAAQDAFAAGESYVPFYDGGANEYVLYSTAELLDQEKESVRTENEKIDESESLREFYQPSATSMKLGGDSRMGIILLAGFMTAAIGAVTYLMIKKKKY